MNKKKIVSILSAALVLIGASLATFAAEPAEIVNFDQMQIVAQQTIEIPSGNPKVSKTQTTTKYDNGMKTVETLTVTQLTEDTSGKVFRAGAMEHKSISKNFSIYNSSSQHIGVNTVNCTFAYDGKKASCISKSHTVTANPTQGYRAVTGSIEAKNVFGGKVKVTASGQLILRSNENFKADAEAVVTCDKKGNVK